MVKNHLQKKEKKYSIISDYVRKDLWWKEFLPRHNGISMMVYEEWSNPDGIYATDASNTGCGGCWQGRYF